MVSSWSELRTRLLQLRRYQEGLQTATDRWLENDLVQIEVDLSSVSNALDRMIEQSDRGKPFYSELEHQLARPSSLQLPSSSIYRSRQSPSSQLTRSPSQLTSHLTYRSKHPSALSPRPSSLQLPSYSMHQSNHSPSPQSARLHQPIDQSVLQPSQAVHQPPHHFSNRPPQHFNNRPQQHFANQPKKNLVRSPVYQPARHSANTLVQHSFQAPLTIQDEIYQKFEHLRPPSRSLQDTFRLRCSSFIKRSQSRISVIKARAERRKMFSKIAEPVATAPRKRQKHATDEDYDSGLYDHQESPGSPNGPVITDHTKNIDYNYKLREDDNNNVRPFTYDEMRAQTAKIYRRLPEVREKERQQKMNKAKAQNRVKLSIYSKRLNQNARQGVINYTLDGTLREKQDEWKLRF